MKSIAATEQVNRLHLDNPWWRDGIKSISYGEFTPRDYLDSFCDLVLQPQPKRAVVLMGPRRVGKTVLIHHTIQKLVILGGVSESNILYVSLDTPVYTGLSLEVFVQFLEVGRSVQPDQDLYFFFDEIQYLKDWEVHLKSLVDTYPHFKFIASGSAAAALKMKSVESGAGRFTDFSLPPLTFAEFIKFEKAEAGLIEETMPNVYTCTDMQRLNELFVDYINYGGYPEAVFSPEIRDDPGRFIKGDILDKVLLRDLPSLYGIRDIQELNRLFTMLAYNSGEEVSIGELSQSSGVSKETLKKYLDYLEAAFLIKRVRRVDRAGKRFQRDRQIKVYLTNPSLRAALFGPVNVDSEEMGKLTETAIFAQWFHSPYQSDSINYARWKGGEVDFVGSDGASPAGIWAAEIKWSDRPYTRPETIVGIVDFARQTSLTGIPKVTTRTKTGLRTIKGVAIEFIPSSLYCYTIGKNVTRGMVSF